jgi:hypothetical protein
MSISFVFGVFQMHSYDCSSNVPGLRVPGDVISDLKRVCHAFSPCVIAAIQARSRISQER